MIELNLPPYPYKVKQEKDKILIFDELRRRYVTLTPEEWVRQHFVAYLVNQKKFPRGLIGNEISLTLNKCNRRCDTIVYDRNGNPLCIAEYKAPHVEITQKTFDSFGENPPEEKWTNDNRQLTDIGSFASVKE